jgi:uncharacterized protein (TIGR01777 family)
VAEKCGATVTAVKSLDEISDDVHITCVFNLAGAPIADRKWTSDRKQELYLSRVDLTKNLVYWLAHRQRKPECLISGSAVGWYGDSGSTIVTENSKPHDEFTHQLCDAWEQQAKKAIALNIRVCIVRTGLVLANNGGFLARLLPLFKLGLGGQSGDGQHYMPWVHISDLVHLLYTLSINLNAHGIYNGCAPQPVTNLEFTKTLSQQLNRPTLLPLPKWLLTFLLGEMAQLLLSGQNALPERAKEIDFSFKYNQLDQALADLLPAKS